MLLLNTHIFHVLTIIVFDVIGKVPSSPRVVDSQFDLFSPNILTRREKKMGTFRLDDVYIASRRPA